MKSYWICKSFSIPASSNPLLLLDKIFLVGFLICQTFIWLNNSLLKSGQRSAPHFWKPARAYLAGFQKLFANSKAFCTKQLRIYKFNVKLKGQLKIFFNLPDSILTKTHHTIPLLASPLLCPCLFNYALNCTMIKHNKNNLDPILSSFFYLHHLSRATRIKSEPRS
jgi:hypothetical protein